MHRAWVAAWKTMGERQDNETVPFCSARDGAAYAKRFSDLARQFPPAGGSYPDNDLGYQLQLNTLGRRVPDNESNGLDHGAGSFLFLFGPISGGLFGEYPDLSNLDGDDNLVATVSMADYYASLAEGWFEVPASEVISGGTPIAGLFA